jgi:snurportin-1
VLDCIWSAAENTFYVLDVVEWRAQTFYASDTEFRSYWLHSRLSEECPGAATAGGSNRHAFVPLPRYACDASALRQMFEATRAMRRDGVLFFHREALYQRGRTSLVCWLRPDMVPSILHVDIGEALEPAAGAGDADAGMR